jgi:hypothetical protein
MVWPCASSLARTVDRLRRPLHRSVDRAVHLRRGFRPCALRRRRTDDLGNMRAEPLPIRRPLRPPRGCAGECRERLSSASLFVRARPACFIASEAVRALLLHLGQSFISTPISIRADSAAWSSACALRSSSLLAAELVGDAADPVGRLVAEVHQPGRFRAERRAVLSKLGRRDPSTTSSASLSTRIARTAAVKRLVSRRSCARTGSDQPDQDQRRVIDAPSRSTPPNLTPARRCSAHSPPRRASPGQGGSEGLRTGA